MSPETIGLIGFAVMLALLALRVPVAVAMISVAVVGYGQIVNNDAALARLAPTHSTAPPPTTSR